MKTVDEWSDAFDVQISLYLKGTSMGYTHTFDEYEKSILLTNAQEDVINLLYGSVSTTFENSEALRAQLNYLVKQEDITVTSDNTKTISDKYKHYYCKLDENCWYKVYEQVQTSSLDGNCDSSKILHVYPVTHDEYAKIIKNPFRGPSNNRVLRLDIPTGVELVSSKELSKYTVRYIEKPSPIILCVLPEGLTIQGEKDPNPCTLPEVLHNTILEYAVKTAINTIQKTKS